MVVLQLPAAQNVGGTASTVATSAVNPSMGDWHHFEIRAYGSQLQVYVDGVQRINVDGY